MIERVDKYTILVDGVRVTAGPAQESRIRSMSDQQRKNFVKIMTGGKKNEAS